MSAFQGHRRILLLFTNQMPLFMEHGPAASACPCPSWIELGGRGVLRSTRRWLKALQWTAWLPLVTLVSLPPSCLAVLTSMSPCSLDRLASTYIHLNSAQINTTRLARQTHSHTPVASPKKLLPLSVAVMAPFVPVPITFSSTCHHALPCSSCSSPE
jgi:hypothetical protein